MMTSSSISAHELRDHPFSGIQIVTQTNHHDHVGHYCHGWVSHHHQLDQHEEQVGSGDGLNQVVKVEKGIDVWAWGQKVDHYDPSTIADIDSDDIHDNCVPSSKLRVVRKMNPKKASTENSVPSIETNIEDRVSYVIPDNDSSSNNSGNNGNNNGIRVCSDCNTTKTPLWRSGPQGPKSLCNACGIRQRKARRALAAAASTDNNVVTKVTACSRPESLKIKISNTSKDKKTITTSHDNNWQQPYKKRLKQFSESPYTSASQDSNLSNGKDHTDDQCVSERNNNKGICFEEFITASLSNNAALHRVFPQDEKEAAILLMALSCGLVHKY